MRGILGKKSKIKGNTFEREISKLFTKWWNDGMFNGSFYKTPASGGLRQGNREGTVGDLVTPEGFTCTIECKNQEAWDYRELFQQTIAKAPRLIQKGKNKGKPNSPKGIGEFWFQACDEANRANRIPLLVFTKNYHKDLIIVPEDTNFGALYGEQFREFGVSKTFDYEERLPYIRKTIIIQLSKFLEVVEPVMLRKE